MSRKRIALGGYVYHVMNRANGRLRIFKKDDDFAAFENVIAEGLERVDIRICSYCIMGNHWHLLLWPRSDGDLVDFVRWITLTHTQRFHASHGTAGMGHVYRGRYKSFPVQSNRYYINLLRYIEANPFKAGLVEKVTDWQWSSLAVRMGAEKPFVLSDGPVPLPGEGWIEMLETSLAKPDLKQIGSSLEKNCPLGESDWVKRTAQKLELLSTIRPPGRPKKGS